MPVPVRTEAACWLSSPAVTKTATRSAVSSLCSCRGRLAVGCTEQGAVWFLCFLGSQTNLQEMASEERIRAHLRLPLLPSGGGTSNQALLESSQSHSAVTVDAVFAGCTCSRTGSSSKNRKLRWILLFFLCSCTCIFSFLPFLSDSQRSFLSRDALPPYAECPVHVGAVGCFPTESRCPPLSCFSRH